LRKLLMGALAASATIAVASAAVAQSPEAGFTAKVSPSDAGTSKKPKNTTLNFNVTLDKPNTTVEFIDLALPKGLKLSGKGLKRCSVDTLAAQGPSGCPSGSKAGPSGSATADLGPEGPSQSVLNFVVSPFVLDSNTLVFYVASDSGSGIAVQSPITGEITAKGRKLRIRIPQELRQPVPGVDASLTSLNQTFSGKAGKHYLVSSIGCAKHKHKFTGKLTFTNRADGAAVPPAVPIATSASCKK
jgi:opacity protein-like surface antigen